MFTAYSSLTMRGSIESTYAAISQWLKPDGDSSQAIDFASHNLTARRNGHWSFGDLSGWTIVDAARLMIYRRHAP